MCSRGGKLLFSFSGKNEIFFLFFSSSNENFVMNTKNQKIQNFSVQFEYGH